MRYKLEKQGKSDQYLLGTDAVVAVWQSDGYTVTPAPLPAPPSAPKLLSKTAFMDHCVAQLGSVAAFQALMEACRDSTDATYGATLRYAYARYDAADVLSKDKVGELSAVMVSAGLLEGDERTAVLDNWPT